MVRRWVSVRSILGALLAGILVLTASVSSQAAAVYIPTTIAGGAESDRLGAHQGGVSLSADGTSVALAGTQTKDVRVFAWDGTNLSQQGSTISVGGDGRRSVSIDDVGDSIAVGEPYSDLAGTNRGSVRIYDYDGASWGARGDPVNGVEIVQFSNSAQDRFGFNVGLSGDGQSFVASGHGSSTCSGNGGSLGSVKVFQWSGTTWAQRGSTLEGDDCDVQLGSGLQISDSGHVIAATTETHTQIYEWDTGASDWVQMGSSIARTGQISLSDDGSRIAIGVDTGAGSVRVYEFTSGSWALVGSQIDGENSGDDFSKVALNGDGSTLIVGAANASPRGEVSVLDWDGSAWTERFADMQGSSSVGYVNFGFQVDISEDGRVTAASDYKYDSYRGLVRLNAVGPFSLSYDLNGGDGGLPSAQTGDFGTTLTVASSEPNRTGYSFEGWSLTAGGTLDYAAGSSFSVPLSDTTLYARWELAPASSPSDNSGGQRIGSAIATTPSGGFVPEPQSLRPAGLSIVEPVQFPATLSSSSAGNKKAKALVAGRLVDVTVSANSRGAKLFDIGGVRLSLRSATLGSRADNPSQPGFSIAASQKVVFNLGGLEPISAVQVFFPLASGSFLQLDDLTANRAGEVSVEIDSSAVSGNQPFPIGVHKVQVVSVSALGEQIVIEVPLEVAQPDPAPQPPGLAGENQNLQVGASQSLVNGVPLASSAFISEGGFGSRGDDWEITFAGDARSEGLGGFELSVISEVRGTVGGFMPETRVDIWLYSTPLILGSAETGQAGEANFLVDLGAISVPPGPHTLQVQGVTPDGYIQVTNLAVELSQSRGQAASENGEAALNSRPAIDSIPALIIGFSLIGFAVTALLLVRYRRARGSSG